jgi:MtN3 and saliva related transmembrane protein
MNHAEYINALGLMAGSLTTIAFLPQVLKTWRTRATGDISLGMFVIFSSGSLLWAVYGVFIHSLPVVIANAVTLVLALTILFFKIRYR